MTDRTIDELGPVDYLIVEFPAGHQHFTGEGAAELVRLHDAGIIRLMDILILQKAEDGTVMAQELGDLDELGELQRIETELVQTLAEEDVEHLAAAMDPGSVAGVLVYENLWAAPFASAMRRAGGQLIANGRIPIQAIIAAVEADLRPMACGVHAFHLPPQSDDPDPCPCQHDRRARGLRNDADRRAVEQPRIRRPQLARRARARRLRSPGTDLAADL